MPSSGTGHRVGNTAPGHFWGVCGALGKAQGLVGTLGLSGFATREQLQAALEGNSNSEMFSADNGEAVTVGRVRNPPAKGSRGRGTGVRAEQ